MRNITIRELAKELGLSVSTISKALRDSHEISPETKLRVLEKARALNYMPNPYASSLRHRKSKTIAVVLPEVSDSFFSEAINGIESVAQEKGYHVLIYLTHEKISREESILNEFQSGRVDGVLISVTRETNHGRHIEELMNNDIPVVFFDRSIENVQAARVMTNDVQSAYEATLHLLQQGCRNPAFLSVSEYLSIIHLREEGFKKALTEEGIEHSGHHVLNCPPDIEATRQLLIKQLQTNHRPDGFLVSVEKLTYPVYEACRSLKLTIPEEVKVVSFSNLAIGTILNPALSTIEQPAYAIGEKAAELLFKALAKPMFDLKKEHVVIASDLHQRASSLRG